MSSPEEPPRPRGLPSIQQAREERSAGKHRWPKPKFWGYAGLILAISAILHWKWSQNETESARQKLMARQRAAAAELGPRWVPLRDKIERWTAELASDAGPDVVDPMLREGKWDFRDRAGIYLRLRVDEAKDPKTMRERAMDSLRDGFTACLMRVPNQNPLAGPECKRTRDCPQNQFCNEVDHCAPAAQPFNLRVAYRTMRILTDEWVHDVQDASSELRLRMLVAGFDDTMQDDVPLAVNLLQRAQYFMLVLDEDVAGMPKPAPDAGVTPSEAVQAVPHMARVGVWRLEDGKQLLRVRREASGQLLGATPQVDADALDARSRQANSCALALAVREAMGDTAAAAAPPQK